MNDRFNAVLIDENDGKPKAELTTLSSDELPDHEVLLQLDYSTLNYKDALALSGRGKICRRFPMVGGIDLAGVVKESSSDQWQPGDQVVVNGFGLSEKHWGGYSQFQKVRPEWLVKRPEAFSAEQAMAIGTAGYTAMLCVSALLDHGLQPDAGPVVVTGASGGVGSVAVALLASLNFEVVAVSGRASSHEYLMSLGASKIIAREELDRDSRPLEKEIWAAGIDSVGSKTLASLLAQTQYEGIVAACGLAGGFDLPSSVMPFILRGVTLRGIDSVMASQTRRQDAWDQLAKMLDLNKLASIYSVEPMSKVISLAEDLLDGRLQGRVVIDVNA